MADDSILSVAPDTVAPADGAAAIDIPAPYPLPDTQAELVKEFGQGVNGDAGAISNGDLSWTPVLLPTTASGTGVTKKINGGTIGLDHRKQLLKAAKKALGI